jgi:hypothetical protein
MRKAFVSLLVGALSVGLAWAGAGLVPVTPDAEPEREPEPEATSAQAEFEEDISFTAVDLEEGQVLAGAAKVSMEPRPGDYGGQWETSREQCKIDENPQSGLMHVADFRVRWPNHPDCIYMGGYGIGPIFPILEWTDPFGLWVRAVAIEGGGGTIVLLLLDGVYYFGEYNNLCQGCGFFDLAEELGEELGIDPASFFFASSHSHTAPDFIGGWGGVPEWYMDQTADAIRAAVKAAVNNMEPAVLEVGEEIVRERNAERRDFYRSAEEAHLTWFRLLRPGGAGPGRAPPRPGSGGGSPGQGNRPANEDDPEGPPEPPVQGPAPGPAIATVAAYAAHPVTAPADAAIADADFPGVFAARVEEAFGGVGMLLQTGFGNMSPRGDKTVMGEGLASRVPDAGAGRRIADPRVSVAQRFWNQPVTNSGLTALGLPGFFDRPFQSQPSSVDAGKHGQRRCRSASPVTVRTAASAARIGALWITGAPGEVFANLTNSIKERNPTGVTMPLSMVNDGLGYIMQSFETDHVGRQAVGFVGGAAAEYEDAYSIDACFGDMTLETTLELLGSI